MRRAVLAPILIELVACHQTQLSSNPTGWHLTPDRGGYEGQLSYSFGDGERTTFVAKCNGSPWFMLLGGDYSAAADKFTVTADKSSWTLHISKGEHGRGLFVDQQTPAAAISTAKQKIEFVVGNWKRELRPSSELARFVSSCSDR